MKHVRPEECLQPDLLSWDNNDDIKARKVIKEVEKKGDKAVTKWTRRFDGVHIENFRIPETDLEEACRNLDKKTKQAMEFAAGNIRSFAMKQAEMYKPFIWNPVPGVGLEQRIVPVGRVGVYVPGGKYPLFSSLLMGALPAAAAGVEEVAVCTPPDREKKVHPVILAAAGLAGVDEVYKIGGIQAVAAMACGTESVKKVDMIVGPGNRFVTAAKKLVYGKVGIDFTAGPSEVLIVADRYADAGFIAADLIAQAEHDEDARPVLVTDSKKLAERVDEEITAQLKDIPDSGKARAALERNGLTVLVDNPDQAVDVVNSRSPEHLELHLKDADSFADRVKNFGSLFIGAYAAEVLGDYSAGINHILPTGKASRYTGGLSVGNFLKIQTVLRNEKKGFLSIGPAALNMAETEGLEGHARAVRRRLDRIRSA